MNRSIGIIGLLLFLLAGCAPRKAREIPLRDFFKNPEQTYYQLSPDGKHISFTKPHLNRMNIHIRAIDDTTAVRITSVADRDISRYFWKGNDYLLYLRDFGGDENYHVFSVDREGRQEKDLTPFEGVRADIVDELKEHPTDVLVQMNKRDPRVFDVFRLNTVTGELALVAENPGNITSWITDHDGKLRMALTADGVNTSVYYRTNETSPFKTIITTTFKESFSPMFFTFDNKRIYAASNLGRDKVAIVEFDPESGTETKVLFEHGEYDAGGLDYSRKRKTLTEVSFVTWKPERKVLDPETETIYASISKQTPGMEVYLVSNNDAEDMFIVRTISDRSMGAYYIYDKQKDELTKISDRAPWLENAELAEMKPIEFTSRDGLKIHGYLTLPAGSNGKNLPVVVNPHGGPWARDVWGFNPEVQFLANRGYAVMQINFRGSTGYGKEFWMKSFKQWGRAMQDDITDGVEWLKAQGIADPKRIAIYGGSYGGYATLAGITLTPDLYAAAVDYVGVSNMFTFMNTIPAYWVPFRLQVSEMGGDPVKDSSMLAEVSPVFLVDRIKTP